jgi:hypothetical protein
MSSAAATIAGSAERHIIVDDPMDVPQTRWSGAG